MVSFKALRESPGSFTHSLPIAPSKFQFGVFRLTSVGQCGWLRNPCLTTVQKPWVRNGFRACTVCGLKGGPDVSVMALVSLPKVKSSLRKGSRKNSVGLLSGGLVEEQEHIRTDTCAHILHFEVG